MSKNKYFNYIFILILVIVVSIYLGKLLYGNVNNYLDLKTTYFDEVDNYLEMDEYDSETDSDFERIELNDLIEPVPKKILEGPINDKADLSRPKIPDVSTSDEDDEDDEYNLEQ